MEFWWSGGELHSYEGYAWLHTMVRATSECSTQCEGSWWSKGTLNLGRNDNTRLTGKVLEVGLSSCPTFLMSDSQRF